MFCTHVSTQQLGDLIEMQQRARASSMLAMPTPHGVSVSSSVNKAVNLGRAVKKPDTMVASEHLRSAPLSPTES